MHLQVRAFVIRVRALAKENYLCYCTLTLFRTDHPTNAFQVGYFMLVILKYVQSSRQTANIVCQAARVGQHVCLQDA